MMLYAQNLLVTVSPTIPLGTNKKRQRGPSYVCRPVADRVSSRCHLGNSWNLLEPYGPRDRKQTKFVLPT